MTTPGKGDPTVEVAIYRYSVDFNTPKPRTKIKTNINGKNTAGNWTDVHTETPTKLTYSATTVPPKTYLFTSYIHTRIISRKLISNIRWYPTGGGDYFPSTTAKRAFFNAIVATEYYTKWDVVDEYENVPLTQHPHKLGEVLGKSTEPSYPDWVGNPFQFTKSNPYLVVFGNTKETPFIVMQFTINVRNINEKEDIVTTPVSCVWIYDDVLEF
jgi:hypothetical protein